MIDLHIHTIMSDGQHSPTEVVNLAAKQGVSILSITDHDTISGVEEGAAAARQAGIQFIPGIEISVKGNRELHILGYCLDIKNVRLKEMCESFKQLRQERERRIFEYLRGKGIYLTAAQVEKQLTHGLVGRPHFAGAMLEAGYVSNYREAFDRYLATEEFAKIERPKPEAKEGIHVIHEAAGAAILAHPAQLNLGDDEFELLLKELMDAGLNGIECYYSTHTKKQTLYYLELAKKYGLLVTGGSDFHGEKVKPEIKIGTGINNSLYFNDNNIIQKLQEVARND